MTASLSIEFQDLGVIAYDQAFTLQQTLHAEVDAGDRGPTVLLVEHPPVITLPRRSERAGHVLLADDVLRSRGIERAWTNRGGDVTYHGPGQLVAYPILRLAPLKLGPSGYVHRLEQVVIDALAQVAPSLALTTDPAAPGVWVQRSRRAGGRAVPADGGDAAVTSAKLCAIGVRVRRGVTLHGLALNVACDLTHFDAIVPCGLHDRQVTSLAAELDAPPTMPAVKAALIASLKRHLTPAASS